MGYKSFRKPKIALAPATFATAAKVTAQSSANVAKLASVAGPNPQIKLERFLEGNPGPWDETCWLAFYEERAAIAEFDGGLSKDEAENRAFQCCIIEWQNRNYVQSSPERCLECGEGEKPSKPLVAYGTESSGHAWLHHHCKGAWQSKREAQAAKYLTSIGIRKGRE